MWTEILKICACVVCGMMLGVMVDLLDHVRDGLIIIVDAVFFIPEHHRTVRHDRRKQTK